jgi:uncharacterized membrane protein
MIADAMITIITSLIATLLAILPDSTGLPAGAQSAFTDMMGFMYTFDFILPIATIITILGIAMAFHASMFTFRGITWLLQKFPGVN